MNRCLKIGDLVRWNYFGRNENTDLTSVGIIVSDYEHNHEGEVYKNVYWMEHQWVRPINPIHLEVISETR